MALIIPFRAVRPVREFVKDVASCPYDTIDSEEARKIAGENPKSFLHVVRSEVDLPEDVDIYDSRVYEKAERNLHNFLKNRILFQDEKPCFYIYRQKINGHEQYGIVACVSIEDYEKGLIKKHELTRSDKESDRTRHITAVNAQTGPLFIIRPSVDSLESIVGKIAKNRPEYDFTADDGVSHTIWVVEDEDTIEKIAGEFSKINSLYIADGHHRAASAAAVARMRKGENINHNGCEEYNFMMAVIFPHDQLKIMGYNRVVRDLNGFSVKEFIDKVGEKFNVSYGFESEARGLLHEIGMYLEGKWYSLKARHGSFDEKDAIGSMDVCILQNNLLGPVLGIKDPRTDERIIFVGGIRGTKELENLVDSGKYAVAFALYPVTVESLMNVADEGKIMPPKSTWFEPKLRSGIFVHVLD